MLDLFRGAETH